MQLTVEIDCDNAAFADGAHGVELAFILEKLAKELADGYFAEPGQSKKLYDSNGNRVGTAVLHES